MGNDAVAFSYRAEIVALPGATATNVEGALEVPVMRATPGSDEVQLADVVTSVNAPSESRLYAANARLEVLGVICPIAPTWIIKPITFACVAEVGYDAPHAANATDHTVRLNTRDR